MCNNDNFRYLALVWMVKRKSLAGKKGNPARLKEGNKTKQYLLYTIYYGSQYIKWIKYRKKIKNVRLVKV